MVYLFFQQITANDIPCLVVMKMSAPSLEDVFLLFCKMSMALAHTSYNTSTSINNNINVISGA